MIFTINIIFIIINNNYLIQKHKQTKLKQKNKNFDNGTKERMLASPIQNKSRLDSLFGRSVYL